MKLRCISWLAIAVLAASSAAAQGPPGTYGGPSLLPLPPVNVPTMASRPMASAWQPVTAQPVYYGDPWASYQAATTQPPMPQSDSGAYQEAADSSWCDECTGSLPTCCRPCWFGGIYGLYMTRDRGNPVWTSVDDNDPGGGVLGTPQTAMDWQPGVEARLGRTFAGGCFGWEVVYWTIFSSTETATVTDGDITGDLITPLTFDNLNLGADNVADWFDGAQAHRLRSTYEFHNIELNLLRLPQYGSCGCGFACGSVLGLRYLRINENFQFASDDSNTIFGDSPDDEMYYRVDMRNSLLGAQLGCYGAYTWTCRLGLFTDVKLGVYDNRINLCSSVTDGNGTYATVNNGPNSGSDYNLGSAKDDVAFLGELRLGGSYQISACWRAVLAYRALAVTGVALPGSQIPANFGDLNGASNIDSNGSLILHGLQFGVQANY